MVSKEKIALLKKLNTDYSRFIINVVNSYEKKDATIKKKIKENIYGIETEKFSSSMINLDNLWAEPYFNTIMRRSLDKLIMLLENEDIENIKANPNKFCKRIIYNKTEEFAIMPEGMINIVDFIKEMNVDENLYFYASEINEETIFKAEQLTRALILKTITDETTRVSKLYDYVYDYLKEDFIANNYCDFIDNKCIAQRHIRMYPWHIKNGCCYNEFFRCKHFNKANCDAKCMACTLFSCPFLSKMHITYYGREILLFSAFLTQNQMKHMIYDFYKTKNEVVKAVLKK